jgi:hypothetical protein
MDCKVTEKSRAEQKKVVSFLCRDGVTSPTYWQGYGKIESRTKECGFFFMPFKPIHISVATKNRAFHNVKISKNEKSYQQKGEVINTFCILSL